MDAELFKAITDAIDSRRQVLELFRESVHHFFERHPRLITGPLPTVHSVRSRTKGLNSLEDKLDRKLQDGESINAGNIFSTITDLVGVRVLHVYQEQVGDIHAAILAHVDAGEWVFHEGPRAYTWDPEARDYMESLGLSVEVKDSFYTSVHYVVRPRPDAAAACEIQVRTLFEEAWGEIDHAINYPHPTTSLANGEQLRVLARLVSTGSRLATSIFKVHDSESN